MLWLWMFMAGAGIGPTLSVFTIVVQNAVPFSQLGVATSNLTFFRQIGGSIGLAITGTIFGTRLIEEIPVQLTAAGLPPQAVAQFSNAGTGALDNLVGVGGAGGIGAQILALVPEAFRALVEPLIPAIVTGIHQAFSIAVLGRLPDRRRDDDRLRGRSCRAGDPPAHHLARDRAGQPCCCVGRHRCGRVSVPPGRFADNRLIRPSSCSTAPVVPTGAVVRVRQ